ncbi:TraB/GumN family protein [Aquicoccus sp. G2-2]|uniref:TraB/GumN family protein n=1 Tax=Aquicoccus sp. G2-2 TaxID=3092120 RepID=UPI00366CFA9A
MSPCRLRDQASGAKGVDESLAMALDHAGFDTRSIENPLTTLKLLDGFSRDEQLAMLRLSLDLPLDPDDLQATMIALYTKGRIAALWEYGRWVSLRYGGPTAKTDFARLEKALLSDRNSNWVKTIEQEATGKTVFIAVGAGHLPGKAGLLNLLAKRGYAITRLPFTP